MVATLSSYFLPKMPFGVRKTGVRRTTTKLKSCRCEATTESRSTAGEKRATVRNGDDSLVICRVLNGMWQTSGGWGRIDRDDAVDSMLRYGTVLGGLLSEKFLDTNISIPFAAPPLNTPSLQKYKRMIDAWGGWNLFQVLLQTLKKVASKYGVSIPTVAVRYILDQRAVAGSMIGVRLGLSQHVDDSLAIFSLELDEEDRDSIDAVSKKGRDLLQVIGDCGDEYRRA